MLRSHTSFVCCFVGAVFLAGCGRKPVAPTPASAADGLREIVEVYKYLDYSGQTPPRFVEELTGFIDTLPNALPRIQSGEYELAWGVGLSSIPLASGGVLAFEKNVATEGGAVLLRDGTVRQMTPHEFAAARRIH